METQVTLTANEPKRCPLSDSYLMEFQEFLDRRRCTLRQLNELERNIGVFDQACVWFTVKWQNIEKIKNDILNILIKNNTTVSNRDGNYHVGLFLLKNETEKTFRTYLESLVGYLPIETMRELDHLHYNINEAMHCLYGTYEFHKRWVKQVYKKKMK
jgi:hypothetical protein